MIITTRPRGSQHVADRRTSAVFAINGPQVDAVIYGFERDLRYVEILLMELHLHASAGSDPQTSPSLSDEEAEFFDQARYQWSANFSDSGVATMRPRFADARSERGAGSKIILRPADLDSSSRMASADRKAI